MSLNTLSSRAIAGMYYARLKTLNATMWPGLVATEPLSSDQESETYKWLGMTPALREWIGGRHAKGLRDNGITIANKEFEATLEIKVADIRRDKTAQIRMRINELAQRGLTHWASLLSTLIAAGDTGDCYDGKKFFAADHAEGSSGTQVNLLTNSTVGALDVTTAASPTAAEMEAAILGVISHMLGYLDDQGEPTNEDANAWVIMCPKGKIYASAVAAVKNAVINQSTNTLPSTGWDLKVVCNPRLTWTTDFAVFRADADVKALIRQEEIAPTLKSIAEGSELEFNNGVWRFGVETTRNVGYGYWQYAAKATLS